VNRILPLSCPPWCQEDVPTDDGGLIHFGSDMVATPLLGKIMVSLERRDSVTGPGVPMIRVEGRDELLTPLQAFELVTTLQAVAVAALVDDPGMEDMP
jgi:hypothetical protein